MGLLSELGNGQGFLKAGFLGFPKSGKTYTSALLAIGARYVFKHEGPIAMFDTEGGSEYVAPMVLELTGKKLLGTRSRAFDDLLKVGEECVKAGVSVLIADSMTHVWRELCAAKLNAINSWRKSKRMPERDRLEFQDWDFLKRRWGEWTDFYLNSPLHIVIAGRAGFEYDFDVNEETGKKELVKTGVKMKTESEFGFEPSLLVEMQREQVMKPEHRIYRTATVIGDRFSAIDGKQGEFHTHRKKDGTPDHSNNLNGVLEFFYPHLELLKPGTHAPIDTAVKSRGGDESGQDEYEKRKKERTILLEELQAELVLRWPSQTAADKTAKAAVIKKLFATGSWTKVEREVAPETLREGLQRLRKKTAQEWNEELSAEFQAA